jgi:hypothetical protein
MPINPSARAESTFSIDLSADDKLGGEIQIKHGSKSKEKSFLANFVCV